MVRRALVSKFCDGFVLTGGRSSRMGQDKALLEVDGRPLIKIVAANVQRALGEVTLVGSSAKYGSLGIPVIEDIHPGLGPLAGIHAALRHSRKPLVLVVGCDMPFLNAQFLERLAQIAAVADSEVTVAESVDYGLESLCAVYNQSTLPHVEEALERRELKIAMLYEKVRVRKLSAEECRPFNPQGVLFSNVNTPQDFELARRRLEAISSAG
jgi:molybdopterin-guanine dinucleotide biosynthesis protein A